MNIKITEEQHERLLRSETHRMVFGSKLFGTDDENSDTDYICFYDDEKVFGVKLSDYATLPNIHCFQYDDIENKTQFIWCTVQQFMRSFSSGDGTHFIDAMLFGNDDSTEEEKLEVVRTYKIIKAYLGVAKRDMKLHRNEPKKQFHAMRSNYIAECLLNNIFPNFNEILKLKDCKKYPNKIIEQTERLRIQLNGMFDKGELKMYYIPTIIGSDDKLLKLQLESNNIKEFKYK